MKKLHGLILLLVILLQVLGCVTVNSVKVTHTTLPPEQKQVASSHKEQIYSASQKADSSEFDIEITKGCDLLSRKQYVASIDFFKALAISYPYETKAQYFIALAYDESGNDGDALREYKIFVGTQTEDDVLTLKSRSRIQVLKGAIAEKLIKASSMLAEAHKYVGSLARLKEAYDLMPSSLISRKIIALYDKFSLSSIAWQMSSISDLLSDKSVSIVPFTDLSRREISKGNAVAMELRNELVNMGDLEVYVRDEDSIKAILREIEFGSSGSINEKTRKQLGKLVSTGAIITGRIGYVADTFKINGWMINVETGKIVSSRSISVLGWNIADTDKHADFNVKVWTDRKEYRIGEPLVINVLTNKDCFLTLLNIRSNGEIWELFPNSYNQNNFIKGNTSHTVPASNDAFQLAIVEPPGQDYIKAIATSMPITRDQIARVLSEDNSILVVPTAILRQDGNSTFRSVSSSEMRGLHQILTRGVGLLPDQHSNHNSDSDRYGTGFESAVNTWSFMTKR